MARIVDTNFGPLQALTPSEFEVRTFLRFEAKLLREAEARPHIPVFVVAALIGTGALAALTFT